MNRVVLLRVLTPLIIVLAALSVDVAALAAPPRVTPCDTLAAHPFDPGKVAPGVTFTDVKTPEAVAACTAALKQDEQNPRLQFQLGRALERSGAYAEAVRSYRIAADTGYVAAQNALGAMYQDGLGVPQDAGEAVSWFRKAADQGYAVAEDNLGTAYHEGRGVEKDEAQALALFKKAAAQFYQPAAAKLAALAAPASPLAAKSAPPLKAPSPPSPPVAASAAAPAPPQPVLPPSSEVSGTVPNEPPPSAASAPPQPPTMLPAAPTPLPAKEEAALPMDDPQFKSALGVALTQCILPELQKGSTATNDEARSTDLLIGRCQRPWIAWVNECINHGETEDSCIRKSTALARSAIKQFTQ